MGLRVLVTFLLLMLSCVSGFCQNQDQEPILIEIREQKPLFDNDYAGGKFREWVYEHLKYPKKLKNEGVQGRVTISFIITKNGKLTDVKVIRGAHPLLDKEAVRVIKAAPQKWTCGCNYKGEPIDVHMMFSVIFKL